MSMLPISETSLALLTIVLTLLIRFIIVMLVLSTRRANLYVVKVQPVWNLAGTQSDASSSPAAASMTLTRSGSAVSLYDVGLSLNKVRSCRYFT